MPEPRRFAAKGGSLKPHPKVLIVDGDPAVVLTLNDATAATVDSIARASTRGCIARYTRAKTGRWRFVT